MFPIGFKIYELWLTQNEFMYFSCIPLIWKTLIVYDRVYDIVVREVVNIGIFYSCTIIILYSTPENTTEFFPYPFQWKTHLTNRFCYPLSYRYTVYFENAYIPPLKKIYAVIFHKLFIFKTNRPVVIL